MNQKEIENVIVLEPLERYKYFMKKVADWEIFFTLTDSNDNYIISELEGQKLFPMWSAEEFAKLCQVSGWEKSNIKRLDLDDLENEIVDFIVDKNCLINVFPIYDKTGFIVDM